MKIIATLGLVLGLISPFILTILFGPAAIVLGTIGGAAGHTRGWVGFALGLLSTGVMVVHMTMILSSM